MANWTGPEPRGGGPAGARPHGRAVRGWMAFAVIALIGGGVYLGASRCSSSTPPAASPTTTPSSASPTPTVNPLIGQGAPGRVLAVKIDNVGISQRQQTGLNSADLVYVIQVEGGLSRYLAIYDSAHSPARVGAVRSARQTDIPLLAAFGHVGLAYSGAISGLLRDLAAADVQNITPLDAAGQFSNGGSSPTYITPSRIFAAYPNLAETKDVGFHFGAAPAAGQPAASVSVSMPSASFTFTASGARWLLTVDGRAATTSDQGRINADNVIVQHVHVVPGKYTDYNAGHPDNEVVSVTTGQGAADFYRDGKVWHGQWSKASDTSPTAYTVNGVPMPLTPGRTWIILDGRG